MKKKLFLITLAFGVTGAFAQGLTSKKGEPMLPETGDWAIGIGAGPFLNYAGNLIGGNGLNVAPTFNFYSTNQTILGKYFKDEKTAYRAGIRLGFGSASTTTKDTTLPAPVPPAPVTYVDNVVKVGGTNIGLTAGMEWRKGKTRLQGFYGAEAGISLGSGKTTKTYGNAITALNSTSRDTEIKVGSTFGLGLRGFIGAEYFIFPKMAIGGEFGWGLALATTGEGETTTESWDVTAAAVTTTVLKTGKSSSFGVDTDKMNSVFGAAGTIRLTLHF